MICLVGNILTVKRLLKVSSIKKADAPIVTSNDDDPNITMHNNMKANLQSVLNLFNMLENNEGVNLSTRKSRIT